MSALQDLIPRRLELAPSVLSLPRGSLLLPYQQRALAAIRTTDLLVIEKSRRIGLTWGLAAHAALVAATRRGEGGEDVYYMGYEKDMTREFIDVVAMWARAFDIACGSVEEFLVDERRDVKAFRISFASGFEVVALPSVARSTRGKQGLVILDEAAFVSDLAEVLKAALALTIWGSKVIVVSTHNGVDNPFNQLIDEIRAGRRSGKVVTIPFDDALQAGLYERICLVKGETPTAEGKARWVARIRGIYGDAAAEELDCIPSSGSGSWIPRELITAAEHADAGIPDLYGKGLSWIGWDIARRRDLSCVWQFEQVGRVLWLRERIEMIAVPFAEQYDRTEALCRRSRLVRLSMDETGMGMAPVEEMQRRLGTDRVEGVSLTGPKRLDLATHLKAAFEAGTIRIPHDPEIRADLLAIKKVAGPTGSPRMVEDGEVHPDRFWAAALAVAAAALGPEEYGWQPAPAGNRLRAGALGRHHDDDAPPSLASWRREKGAW